ncbi:RCC1/BLIP-II [Dendrothele bispora CBS 962.96]|uniref:RCC1/BLIP-II n=1 Tax=Dendrothele bispora (strain CBS 962.96) TaxID=1314807 RepID=A0A4V4HGL7_DENBC|nr:RCC1/BLIP-II [Dendrothele bispora CBS 962.96]
MYRRVKIPSKLSGSRGFTSFPSRLHNTKSHKKTFVALSTAVAAGCLTYFTSKRVILNDSPAPQIVSKATSTSSNNADPDALHTLIWGSNASKTLVPGGSDAESIRRPLVASWLDNVALRDLVFHRDHAACVDARGDVYQWGKGFQKDHSKPILTLKGENIVQLQLSENRVYALSSSGKIYASDLSNLSKQQLPVTATDTNSSWWSTSWITGKQASSSGFVEVSPREGLSWGEKFVSISAGNDHLLALTSAGRAFAHPISKNANSYGQLGFRKFVVPDLSSPGSNAPKPVELIPKSVADPYAKASPFKRESSSSIVQEDYKLDDTSVKNCPTVFEIPSLRDVKISSLKAGGRSSFALTDSGRVLGWGANEYGQIGLGPNVTVESITVPTEVILWRSLASGTQTKCLDVAAGGDLTCFTVERIKSNPSSKIFEVLTCGNGQWGGLGNNVFTNAQGTPARARNVSGLMEFSDTRKSIEPIVPESVSVSPTGHVLLTLDTSAGGAAGRDLLAWGKNYDSELGNGKKASLASPTTMSTPEGERFMLQKKKAKEVRDLQGNVWKRGVTVEQKAVTGYCNSAVFWKVS